MAASSSAEMATPTPLNPADGENPPPQLNGHDSTPAPDLPAPPNPHSAVAAAAADDGDAVTGQKRKRGTEGGDGSDQPSPPLLWKTSLCSYFRRDSGSCSHGASCRYAHGEEELRQRPDNTWDPTSERAKKMLRAANGEGHDGASESVREDVLMTEMMGDDDGGDGTLSKCIVHLPRKWSSDQLRKFLDEQVRAD